jgi:hypothetical protein
MSISFYFNFISASLTVVNCCSSTNYLRELTDDMNLLRVKVYSILEQHQYLVPFLKPFNHLQFSINGNKGIQQEKTCQNIQTGMHCDMSYSFSDKNGIQCLPTMNSQEFNTVVAIITVGHSRIIKFERVAWDKGVTGGVIEKRYFILTHLSLFLLHPLDERPALRDKGSKVLSIWRHGDVRLLCNNNSCRGRCDATCHVENENIVSFSLALRCCNHSSIIDTETDTPPVSNDDRKRLRLPPLNDAQKERNINATIELQKYYQSGSKAVFDAWLLGATRKVLDEFYENSIEKKHKK